MLSDLTNIQTCEDAVKRSLELHKKQLVSVYVIYHNVEHIWSRPHLIVSLNCSWNHISTQFHGVSAINKKFCFKSGISPSVQQGLVYFCIGQPQFFSHCSCGKIGRLAREQTKNYRGKTKERVCYGWNQWQNERITKRKGTQTKLT